MKGTKRAAPKGRPPFAKGSDQSAQSAYAVIVHVETVLLYSTASTVHTVADEA